MMLTSLVAVSAAVALAFVAVPAQAETPPGNAIWNGYVHIWKSGGKPVYQDSYVAAGWKVPANKCGASLTDDAIWVGLGGLGSAEYPSTPLMQIGTDSVCLGWHEFSFGIWQVVPGMSWPAPVYTHILYTGDEVYAYVQYHGDGSYTMGLLDFTRDWHFSKDYTVSDTRLSDTAEWIVESPTLSKFTILGHTYGPFHLPLSDFRSVQFDGCYWQQYLGSSTWSYAPTSSNGSKRFEAGSPQETSLSPLRGGGDNTSDFTVTWEHK